MSENPYASPEVSSPSAHLGVTGSPFSVVTDGLGSFQIEHDMQVDDVIDFNLYCVAHAPYFKRQMKILGAAVAMIAASIVFLLSISNFSTSAKVSVATGVIVAVIAMALLFPWFRRRSMAATVRGLITQNSEALGARRTTIDAEGVREVKRYSDSLTRWPAVERIETSQRNVFIYTSELTCVLIPKLAFANQEQLDAFLATARQYLEAGHAARERDRNVLGD
jgi:membrane protein implicated in regulation of membrane protease activity